MIAFTSLIGNWRVILAFLLAVVFVGSNGFSYFKGRGDAKAECQTAALKAKITRQEAVTLSGVGGGAVMNFWIEWAQPALEAAVLLLTFIALVLLMLNRAIDLSRKFKDRQEL